MYGRCPGRWSQGRSGGIASPGSAVHPRTATRYIVDLKLKRYKQLSRPFEAIEFGSDQGKQMWVAVGVCCGRCARRIGEEGQQGSHLKVGAHDERSKAFRCPSRLRRNLNRRPDQGQDHKTKSLDLDFRA